MKIHFDSNGEIFLPDLFLTESNKESDVCVLDYIKYNGTKSWLTNICQTYQIKQDGWYTIYRLILPTKQFLDLQGSNDGIELFYSDGVDIYNYITDQKVDLLTYLEINLYNTNIIRKECDLFSIHHVLECYLEYNKDLFEESDFKCATKLDTYNRDLLYMIVNVIKYYVHFNQLDKAQELLEKVNFCNGLCKESKTKCSCCNIEDLDDVAYIPLSFVTVPQCTPQLAEIGSSINPVCFWQYSKAINKQSIQIDSVSKQLSASERQYQLQDINKDTIITVSASTTNERDVLISKSTVIKFCPGIYWGEVEEIATSGSFAELNRVLLDNRKSFIINKINSFKGLVVCVPKGSFKPKYSNGTLVFDMVLAGNYNFTRYSKNTEYEVYTTDSEMQAGQYVIILS